MTAKDEIRAMLAELGVSDIDDDIRFEVNDKVRVEIWDWLEDDSVLNVTVRGMKPARVIAMLGSVGIFDCLEDR